MTDSGHSAFQLICRSKIENRKRSQRFQLDKIRFWVSAKTGNDPQLTVKMINSTHVPISVSMAPRWNGSLMRRQNVIVADFVDYNFNQVCDQLYSSWSETVTSASDFCKTEVSGGPRNLTGVWPNYKFTRRRHDDLKIYSRVFDYSSEAVDWSFSTRVRCVIFSFDLCVWKLLSPSRKTCDLVDSTSRNTFGEFKEYIAFHLVILAIPTERGLPWEAGRVGAREG